MTKTLLTILLLSSPLAASQTVTCNNSDGSTQKWEVSGTEVAYTLSGENKLTGKITNFYPTSFSYKLESYGNEVHGSVHHSNKTVTFQEAVISADTEALLGVYREVMQNCSIF
ncbi:hypothetical protein [Vibrio sp. Vb339]|uniref:hypothetical protein n=1 Tax=Vibrio sp. Vb339 TaxID=1192013 RepID=UPI001556B5F0|nr:hypothetical protein [Vibrio sp. Vb339]